MRLRLMSLWLLGGLCSSLMLHAGPAKILKVLPQYVDLDGRHSLAPSLYGRDAYQAILRKYPEKRSGLRFDVNWKAKRQDSEKLLLRIELRGSGRDVSEPIVLERPVRPAKFFSTWSSLVLEGED